MCHGQLAQLRERLDELQAAGAQLIAIDPHEPYAAQALLEEVGFDADDVHYPLLCDPAHAVSAAYGVAFQMRIHTELCNRPATFIIDRDGIIRYAKWGRSFADRPSPKTILEELAKLAAAGQ